MKMLKPLCVIAAAVFIVLPVIEFFVDGGKICAQGINQEKPECSGYGFASYPFFFWLRFLDLYNGLIQGLAAIAVVGFTWLLWRVADTQKGISKSQEFLMSRQAEIMNSTLAETTKAANANISAVELSKSTAKIQLRAYITFTAAYYYDFAPGKCLHFRVVRKNTGQTPALNLQVAAQIVTVRSDFSGPLIAEESEYISRQTLGPGDASDHTNGISEPLTEEQYRRIKSKEYAMCFFGQGKYMDIFGDEHKFGFRFFLSGITNNANSENGLLNPADEGNY